MRILQKGSRRQHSVHSPEAADEKMDRKGVSNYHLNGWYKSEIGIVESEVRECQLNNK